VSERSEAPAVARPAQAREPFIDFVRAFSLIVVVMWHWVFTIVKWEDDGPHASNPIGFTSGLWLATWLLQVMPLFFYVGGYGHLRSWERAQAQGQTIWDLVGKRLKQLAIPALLLLGVWVVLGAILTAVFDASWAAQAVKLVVSPLWFIAVYLMLVLLLPAALWLHRRYDVIVLVWLAGLAGAVDIARFTKGWDELALVNMVLVWGLCHQLGFFYDRIVSAARRVDWAMLWAGLFGLFGLVGSGLYPGSMVGVPGEVSNMAPPTLCIVALLIFQAGVAEIIRPGMTLRLQQPRWARFSEVINRFSLPLFLFHSTGMALARAIRYGWSGNTYEAGRPTLGWWLYRPLAIVMPLLCTLPVIYLFGRRWVRPRPAPTVPPATAG
jgi:peptidoglycan/LPS O-acetylase OafA/YrhL